MNLPTIAFTYLTERLYDIVDESNDGRISQDEFIDGMRKVLADNELRRRCKKISYYFNKFIIYYYKNF